MPTTMTQAFKNSLIDSLTGRASTNYIFNYIMPYNNTQPADPSVAPVGVSPYSSYTLTIPIQGFMSAPGMGVSQMSVARSYVAANTVAALTFARLYRNDGVAAMDTPVSLTGGGGGVILDSLSSSVGAALSATKFSFKMPQVLGTVMLNADLVNALASAFCVTAANVGLCTSSVVNIYSGTAPASADAPATGTLLASFVCGTTSPWGVSAAGASALTANLTVSAVATGTAGYARIVKGANVLQGSVGTSAADFILDTLSVVSGNVLTLTEATISI